VAAKETDSRSPTKSLVVSPDFKWFDIASLVVIQDDSTTYTPALKKNSPPEIPVWETNCGEK